MNCRSYSVFCRRAAICSFAVCLFILAEVLPEVGGAAQSGNGGAGYIRTPVYTEEGVEACLSCHYGETMQAIAASPHGNVTNPATPYSTKGCESCHGPGSFHVSRAHGGKGLPQLLSFGHGPGRSSRQEQLGACLACHENERSGSPMIGFTHSVHDVSSINCSRCHVVHTQTDPNSDASRQAGICLACHRKQKDGHPLIGRKPVDFGAMTCSTCHDVHPPSK